MYLKEINDSRSDFMAKKVITLEKEQKQIEFIVGVWSSDFKDRAPKSRNYLYDYIKTKHPDFVCGTDVLRDAQKILKANVEQSKTNFDSISPIQVLDAKIHKFAMELRDQFISEGMELRHAEIADLKSEIQSLKRDLEFHKTMEEHYEKQCSLKDQEISKLLKELEALKEAAANKDADADVDSSTINNSAVTEDLAQSSVLVPEAMEGAKEALEAINKAKEAKLKQPKSKAKNVAKVAKVKLGKEEPNENSSPLALTNEVKQSSADEALINDLSLLVEDVEEPKEATETAEQPSKVASFNGSGEDKTRMDAKYYTMSKRKS